MDHFAYCPNFRVCNYEMKVLINDFRSLRRGLVENPSFRGFESLKSLEFSRFSIERGGNGKAPHVATESR